MGTIKVKNTLFPEMDEEEAQPEQLTPQAMDQAVRGPGAADTTQMTPDEIAIRNQFAHFGNPPQAEPEDPSLGFMRGLEQVNRQMVEGKKDAIDLSEPGTNTDGIPGTATYSHLKNRFLAKDKSPEAAVEFMRKKFPDRKFFSTSDDVWETVGSGMDMKTVPLDPENSTWREVGEEIVADNPRVALDVGIQAAIAAETGGMSLPVRMVISGAASGAREGVIQGAKQFWGDSVTADEALAAMGWETGLGAVAPTLDPAAAKLAAGILSVTKTGAKWGAKQAVKAGLNLSPAYQLGKRALGAAKDKYFKIPIEARDRARFIGFEPEKFRRMTGDQWGPILEQDPSGNFRQLIAANLQPGAEGIAGRLEAAGLFNEAGIYNIDDWVAHAAGRLRETGDRLGQAFDLAEETERKLISEGSLPALTRNDLPMQSMTSRLDADISGSEGTTVGGLYRGERGRLVRRGLGETGDPERDLLNDDLIALSEARKAREDLPKKLLEEDRAFRARRDLAMQSGEMDMEAIEAMEAAHRQRQEMMRYQIADAIETTENLQREGLSQPVGIKDLDRLINSLDDDAYKAGMELNSRKAEVLRGWANELRATRNARMQQIDPANAKQFADDAELYGDLRDAVRAAEAKRAYITEHRKKIFLSNAIASGPRRVFRIGEHFTLSDTGIVVRNYMQKGMMDEAVNAFLANIPMLGNAGLAIKNGVRSFARLELLDQMKGMMKFKGLENHPVLSAAFEGTRRAAEMELQRQWTPELHEFLEQAASYSKSQMNAYMQGEQKGGDGGLPRNIEGVMQAQMVVPMILQNELPPEVGGLVASQAGQLMSKAHTEEGKRQLGEFMGLLEKNFPGIIPWESGKLTGLPSEFDFGNGPRLYLDDDIASWGVTIEACRLSNTEKARRCTALYRDKQVLPLDVELDSKMLQAGNSQSKEQVGGVTIDRDGLVESMQVERNAYGKRITPQ